MAEKKAPMRIPLKDKLDIIKLVEEGVPYKAIRAKHHLKSSSVISMIMTRKEVYLRSQQEPHQTGGGIWSRRSLKATPYTSIDCGLRSFVERTRELGTTVSTSMLKEKALELAKESNIVDFKASQGYINRFKQRNKASFEPNLNLNSSTSFEDIVCESNDDLIECSATLAKEDEHAHQLKQVECGYEQAEFAQMTKADALKAFDVLKLYAMQRKSEDYSMKFYTLVNKLERLFYEEPKHMMTQRKTELNRKPDIILDD
jgi:hypothetical protein